MTFSRPRFAALPDPPTPRESAADLTALFRAHHLELVRLATLLTGDQATAEDVVQDAFERVYAAWGRLAKNGVGLAYIRTAVVNGCRAVHREMAAALAALPRRRREVLVLRYYLYLSEAEIAAVLNISPGTVKSTASRGLAALARTLGEES